MKNLHIKHVFSGQRLIQARSFINITTASKVSNNGVFSGPYLPVFGLNTEIYGVNSVRIRVNTDQKKLHIWTFFAQCIR